MAGKAKKSTKKFIKNSLPRVVQHRKQQQAKTQKFERSKGGSSSNTHNKEDKNADAEDETVDPAATATAVAAPTKTAANKAKKQQKLLDSTAVENLMESQFFEQQQSGDDETASDDDASDLDDDNDVKMQATGDESSSEFDDTSDMTGQQQHADASEDAVSDDDSESEDEELNSQELLASIEQHERELAQLAQSDPAFYEHLQKNDAELLQFSKAKLMPDAPESEQVATQDKDDNESASDDATANATTSAQSQSAAAHQKNEATSTGISYSDWRAIQKSLFGQLNNSKLTPTQQLPSLSALRRALKVYRALCHANDTASEDQSRDNAQKAHAALLAVHSTKTQHAVIQTMCGAQMRDLWTRFIADKDTTSSSKDAASKKQQHQSAHAPQAPRHWKALGPMLKSYLASTLHFVQSLVDESLQRFLLTHLQHCISLFNYFPKLQSKCLKMLISYWSGEYSKAIRIDAFLALYNMFLHSDSQCARLSLSSMSGKSKRSADEDAETTISIQDQILKSTYLAYVRSSKFTTPSTLPVIDFLTNCVVELYAINQSKSYEFVFVYIRQLAIHIRNAISIKKQAAKGQQAAQGEVKKPSAAAADKKKKHGAASAAGAEDNTDSASYRSVYNWQFINCLRVWCKLLSQHADSQQAASKPLTPLLYPLVQILQSTLQIHPVTRYLPLKLIVSQFCCQLAERQHAFIPLSLLLTDVFQCSELRVPPKHTLKARDSVNLDTCLRVNSRVVGSKSFQMALCERTCALLLRYFAAYSYSIAYPELIQSATRALRRFAKQTKIHRIRKQVGAVVQRLEQNRDWIIQQRSQCELTPQSMTPEQGVLTFQKSGGAQSPLELYVAQQKRLAAAGSSNAAAAAAGGKQVKSEMDDAENDDELDAMDDAQADWTGALQPKAGTKRKRQNDNEEHSEGDSEQDEHEDQQDDEDDSEAPSDEESAAAPSAPSAPLRPTPMLSDDSDDAHAEHADQLTNFDLKEMLGKSAKSKSKVKKEKSEAGSAHKKRKTASKKQKTQT